MILHLSDIREKLWQCRTTFDSVHRTVIVGGETELEQWFSLSEFRYRVAMRCSVIWKAHAFHVSIMESHIGCLERFKSVEITNQWPNFPLVKLWAREIECQFADVADKMRKTLTCLQFFSWILGENCTLIIIQLRLKMILDWIQHI